MRKFLTKACAQHKPLLATTITSVIALKILTMGPPLILGKIVDNLTSSNTIGLTSLTVLIGGFILVSCIQAAITPLQIFCLSRLVQRVIMDASIEWTGELMRKEFQYFSSLRIGQFIKSVERGITAHEQLLSFFVTVGLPVCLEFIVIGGVFFYMGGAEVFVAMVLLGSLYLLATHRIIKWRRKHIDTVNEQEDELSAVLFSTLQAGKSIKLENAQESAIRPLNQAFTRYANAAITVASSAGMLNAAKILFISLSTGALLIWGVMDQLSGQPSISVGELVAIFSIAGSFLLNISGLSEAYRVLDQFLADQRRLQQLLSLPDFDAPQRQTNISSNGKSTLTLAPCSITDNQLERVSIKQNVIIHQGESIAITGPSGAGKSTLLEALAGVYDCVRGQLKLDGIEVSRLSADTHLAALRYCPQMPVFLEGSFNQSVLFGQPPSRNLQESIRLLQLDDVVRNRIIAEGASNISGGEAKRLSLLRLINKPGLFNFFDEPSSSIEPKLATPVWDLLFTHFAGRGLICVTHDVEHLSRFDRVIVMRNGAIVDQGPWADLNTRDSLTPIIKEMQEIR